MFRPSDPVYVPFPLYRKPTGIDDLPDELLLNIGDQFTGFSRNRDLANLALVSRKWQAIAQEWLLKKPSFNITYIDQYIWELSHRSELLGQVKGLEIWSTSEGRIQLDEEGKPKRLYTKIPAPDGWDLDFRKRCKKVIKKFAPGTFEQYMWKGALRKDVVPALFGVLICMLPNLKELNLGNGWLMDFPIFSTMLSQVVGVIHSPLGWQHEFLACALGHITPRLEVLEVSADMSSLYLYRAATVFDFRTFRQLKSSVSP
jgi:hypothetical protein